jgi:hypothetical protein
MRWDQVNFAEGVLHVRRVKQGISSVHPLRGPELRALGKLQRETVESPHYFWFNRLNYAKSALAMPETLSRWASWLKADFLLIWKAGILTR